VYFQLSSQIPTRRGKTGLPATFNQDVRSWKIVYFQLLKYY
jgi:hypothetical protein